MVGKTRLQDGDRVTLLGCLIVGEEVVDCRVVARSLIGEPIFVTAHLHTNEHAHITKHTP
uniref:Uncharacterized protein n=1 Tax=Anopheles funestus TaxID=62324 RepID=A0A182S1E9_ANOFN